jgi:hypothetical protein
MRDIDESRKTYDEEQKVGPTLLFEAAVNNLVLILMTQAKIFQDLEKYQLVKLLLLKYADFWIENRTWKLNLVHTYFMRPGKMAGAIALSAPVVLGEQNLLNV